MKIIRNEKGVTLTYVLMAFVILALFIPVILNMSSTSNLNNIRADYKNKANELTVSAMESFLAYLKEKPDPATSYESYFNNFPGWGNYSIRSPEGVQTVYKFGTKNGSTINTTPAATAGNSYDVKVSVVVGSGNISMNKELVYNISVPIGTGSGASTPGSTTQVNSSTITLLNSTTVPTDSEGVITTSTYPNYQSDYNKMVPSSWNLTYTSWTTFSSNIVNDIANTTAIAPSDTLTIKCTCGTQTLDTNLNISSKKIVLYYETGNLTIQSGSLNMSGILLINGDLTVKNTGSLTANNVFVSGNADYTQNGAHANMNISGTFGAGTSSQTSGSVPNITDSNNTFSYPNSDTATASTSPWQPTVNN